MENDLVSRITEAARIISARSPDCAAEASKLIQAARVKSPVLYRRLYTLIGNAHGAEWTRSEKKFIGELLIDLESTSETSHKQNGTRSRFLRLRLTPDAYNTVQLAAEEASETISEYVRRRLDLSD